MPSAAYDDWMDKLVADGFASDGREDNTILETSSSQIVEEITTVPHIPTEEERLAGLIERDKREYGSFYVKYPTDEKEKEYRMTIE